MKQYIAIGTVFLAVSLTGCTSSKPTKHSDPGSKPDMMSNNPTSKENKAKSARPESWAKPIQLKGVPNFHQLSPDLYRSAQPSATGMQKLKQMNIETVINLRSFHSDRDEIDMTGLGYEHIYMKAWHPEYKEIVRFLQLVTNPKRLPVLVHCQHGADRTGTMCAIYRIVVEGWTKEDAIKEMTDGGFGFHEIWKNLPGWIEDLDIESIKKDAGISSTVIRDPGKS